MCLGRGVGNVGRRNVRKVGVRGKVGRSVGKCVRVWGEVWEVCLGGGRWGVRGSVERGKGKVWGKWENEGKV